MLIAVCVQFLFGSGKHNWLQPVCHVATVTGEDDAHKVPAMNLFFSLAVARDFFTQMHFRSYSHASLPTSATPLRS